MKDVKGKLLEPSLHETHDKLLDRGRKQKIIAGDFNGNKVFNAPNSGTIGRLRLEKRDGTCVVNSLAGPRDLISQKPGNDR